MAHRNCACGWGEARSFANCAAGYFSLRIACTSSAIAPAEGR